MGIREKMKITKTILALITLQGGVSSYNAGNGYFLPAFLQQTVLDYFRTKNLQPPVVLKQAIPAVEIASPSAAPSAPAIARSPQRMTIIKPPSPKRFLHGRMTHPLCSVRKTVAPISFRPKFYS